MHAKLGFDFYGLGNAGDDLMLAGFLDIWRCRKPLFAVVSKSQQKILERRFPEIMWLTSNDQQPSYDLWLGVGDTPIQVLSGPWFLEYLERELVGPFSRNIPVIFVGIGVEREATQQKARFHEILKRVHYISTRDEKSAECLIEEFGVDGNRVIVGDDLANIYLSRSVGRCYTDEARSLDLAVNYFSENASRFQWWAVHRWLQDCSLTRSVAVLANECRLLPGSEARRYAELAWLCTLRRPLEPLPLLMPNRWATRVGDLVSHLSPIHTVMSSRFHCLLAAAWAGCKVVALSRSSKIEMLRSRLGLAEVCPPFTPDRLDTAYRDAKQVPFARLEAMCEKAAAATRLVLASQDQ